MHSLDEKLIRLLRHNARRSISDLAIEVGTSRATVRARIDKLERSGSIIGYTVVRLHGALGIPWEPHGQSGDSVGLTCMD